MPTDELPAPASTSPAGGCALSSDRFAFEAAIAPLMPRLYRFCLTLCRDRAEADDLLQDGVVKAFLHADSFEGRGDLFGWLCGILRNQFVETRRAAARRRTLLDSVLEGCTSMLGSIFTGGSETPDPEAFTLQNEQATRLLECLHTLPEEFRLVVLLCDIEELSHEDVASILQIPIGTVKSRHARGRARLSAAFLARQHRSTRKGGGSP
jgi:RNA polymerase sigma-70 factor (ECF subfamily)